MDAFEDIKTVLAVRQYQDKPIPQDVVHRIVEAAQLTGSSMNKQPWHFVVVDDKATLSKLAELIRTGPYIDQAPLAVAVAVEKDSKFGVSDGSRAIQSMILTAWDAGVGSNWVGFSGMPEIRQLLGVPDSMEMLAVIPFGYPAQPAGKGKKNRKPLGDIASHNKFGQPYK